MAWPDYPSEMNALARAKLNALVILATQRQAASHPPEQLIWGQVVAHANACLANIDHKDPNSPLSHSTSTDEKKLDDVTAALAAANDGDAQICLGEIEHAQQ
jgi:hypothetical protein